MIKKRLIFLLIFCNFLASAQQQKKGFKTIINSLKEQNNYSEYIYVHLDEFAKNPDVKNLNIFETLKANLWRSPSNNNENTAQLYFYINYAYQLKEFGFINQSINYYEKAYEHFKINAINYNIIEYCLKPLANNYTRLGDVDNAEDILKIIIEQAISENNKEQIGSGYLNLAIVYRTKGDPTTAINYLNLGLESATSNYLKAKINSDLAINYLMLENIKKAENHTRISNKLNKQDDASILARNFKTLGSCFIVNKEFKRALVEFKKALKYSKKAFGSNDREVAKIHNLIAEVYRLQNNTKTALETYQKALSTLLPNYAPKNEFENPESTYFYPENTLKIALDGRATIFTQNTNFEAALKNYELSFLVEKELNNTYLNQNAKLLQQQENRSRSEKCIELCYMLFEQTNFVGWIEKAFEFAEKTKASILLENKSLLAAKSAIKSDSLFRKEAALTFKKAQLNKSITIEQLKKENAALNVLAALTKERVDVGQQIQLLNQEIELKYPNLKLDLTKTVSIKTIQEELLVNNDLLIEFFEGMNYVYVFSISKNNPISVKRIEKTPEFKDEISRFLALFSDARGTAIQNNIKEYTTLAFGLFNQLFDMNLPANTIIIPDGLFSFLPFDALLTEETAVTNFEKLPYLIYKTAISYGYSASILWNDSKITNQRNNKLLGFFPVFKNNHRNLAELGYTAQEAISIKNELDGEFLIGEAASKTSFNILKDNFSILHLSTHATAGDLYTPPAIEFYNKTLYLPEIYGYNLNYDLVVLSACETGVGTLSKGEGVLSLARGFSYAGVKNLIVSLWKVNDKSTERLMAGFYKNYKKLGNKSNALHASKLTYLEDTTIPAIKKSPYYWASFIYLGEVTALEHSINSYWFIFIVLIAVIGCFIFFKNSRFGLNK
ncbi:CHAT domain-containing protein [Lutibacter sp. A80]|uniref:CHAT domain-containing protein n=1 Tax=Lutibacter sp. A80 TaxID=2918453 RepID=UPI001F05C940|nr:CHAT domain-containing protein [Lutibacter sp. A80]UMB59856.1 CHAT domain-containing protein [Lutibacter sp. A80]